MKKFPVTSKNGVEYEVKITRERYKDKAVQIALYLPSKWIFGRIYKRIVNFDISGYSYYSEEDWDYDYVAMTMQEIKKYEDSIADGIRREREESGGVATFTEWDGKC